jgi:signal transduction histidine kinase
MTVQAPPSPTEPPRPWWARTIFTVGLTEMSHRPPLPRRWAVYCAAAYLIPLVMIETLPADQGVYKEISWLATLAPAFIFSLHFGMLGAAAALVAGTLLYIVVQLILHTNLMPVNQEILVPIYVSYGALAIAVGWLSQQLHDFYQRLIRAERLAAIGEVAVTIRHEVNNALASVIAEAGLLKSSQALTAPEDRQGVETILEMGNRIATDLRKLANLADAPSTGHAGAQRMIDLSAAAERPAGA